MSLPVVVAVVQVVLGLKQFVTTQQSPILRMLDLVDLQKSQ
jgi:hypothetical protein